MSKQTALQRAEEIIYGDREKTYGDPAKNLNVIAVYWENYMRSRGFLRPDAPSIGAVDVCNMMVLLKVARLGNTPGHEDSIVDGIGYLALADRVIHDR